MTSTLMFPIVQPMGKILWLEAMGSEKKTLLKGARLCAHSSQMLLGEICIKVALLIFQLQHLQGNLLRITFRQKY